MYVYCNLYNIFFSKKNKINIIKKGFIKSNIRDNICDMKQLQ